MFSVANFLDRAKARAGIESDYRLSKLTGIAHSALSGYRHGRSMPDERAIEKLCAISGDDPEHAAACIQSMRAANDDAADLWRRVAARLQKGIATVAAMSIVALISIALHLTPVQAAVSALSASGGSLYIMLSALWRLARRLGRMVHLSQVRPLALA